MPLRFDVLENMQDGAVFSDYEGCAFEVALPHTVLLGDGVIRVRQERKIQVVLVGERGDSVNGIGAYAQDRDVRFVVVRQRIAEAAKEGGKPLPSLHSDVYYPIPEPSIKTGVKAMSLAVLNLVGK